MRKYHGFASFAFVATLLFHFAPTIVAQEKPQHKVDLSIAGRNDDETLEPGYTVWRVAQKASDSKTIEGVTYTLSVPSDASYVLRTGWNKGNIQNAENKAKNGRLTYDGVALDPTNQLYGAFTLKIEGLPVGEHTLQSYHNNWENPANWYGTPITIKCNGTVVHENVAPIFGQNVAANAGLLTTKFSIHNAGDVVEIEFSTSEKNPGKADSGQSKHYMVPLCNGFELNTVSVVSLAKDPYPADGDMHVDADSKSLTLKWSPANKEIVKHILYWGTDSATVSQSAAPLASLTDTTYQVDGLYSMNTYFWRVDEEDAQGQVARGKVWSFKPRQLAFHGAEGYGRFANGGRGGRVVYVTNLNDSGEGSFRQAATSGDGPRTILFDVSGIIALESRLVIDKNVTVAGQTAPGKGICFRKSPIGLNHDNIMRFVRLRLGHGETADGIGMGGVREGIMDHCSISWTIDEAFSSRNAKNITLQRTLISEALSIANHKNYEEGTDHGFAGSIGGDIGTFHHNLLANNSGRNWSLAGGLDGNGYLQGRLDIFNMVVYNWSRQACYNGAHEVNFVNNYYKRGPATNQTNATKIMLTADEPGAYLGTQRYYFAGNVMPGVFDETNQEKGRTPNGEKEKEFDRLYYKQWVDSPFFPSYAKIESARDAYKTVLSDVGANMPIFDDHDKRMVEETLTGTYHYVGSRSGHYGLIDSEEDCGGYEDYGSEVRPRLFDTDRDGLPDWWEELFGTDPHSPQGDFSDSNADLDGDGFTMLEDYLDWMATPHLTIEAGQTGEIELKPLTAGFTTKLDYALPDLDGMMLKTEGDILSISAKSDYRGIQFFEIQISDEEGTIMNRRLAICVTGSSTHLDPIVNVGPHTEPIIYNLQGQRLAQPTKGINIIDGRKVIH